MPKIGRACLDAHKVLSCDVKVLLYIELKLAHIISDILEKDLCTLIKTEVALSIKEYPVVQ